MFNNTQNLWELSLFGNNIEFIGVNNFPSKLVLVRMQDNPSICKLGWTAGETLLQVVTSINCDCADGFVGTSSCSKNLCGPTIKPPKVNIVGYKAPICPLRKPGDKCTLACPFNGEVVYTCGMSQRFPSCLFPVMALNGLGHKTPHRCVRNHVGPNGEWITDVHWSSICQDVVSFPAAFAQETFYAAVPNFSEMYIVEYVPLWWLGCAATTTSPSLLPSPVWPSCC